MEQKQKRTAEEIEQLLEGYKKCGQTRRQYCEQEGISLTTLDYYQRSYGKPAAPAKPAAPRLMKVTVKAPAVEPSSRFTLVLLNGRRIESDWHFIEAELLRLIRVTEAA